VLLTFHSNKELSAEMSSSGVNVAVPILPTTIPAAVFAMTAASWIDAPERRGERPWR